MYIKYANYTGLLKISYPISNAYIIAVFRFKIIYNTSNKNNI